MNFALQLASLQKRASSAAAREQRNDDTQQPPRRPREDYHRGGGRDWKRRRHNPRGGGRGGGRGRFHEDNDEKYRDVLVHLPKSIPDRSRDDGSSTRHLTLLFITIDDLPFESIWRKWLEDKKECGMTVSMIGHAKFPERVKSDWLRERLLPKSFRPEWGSIEITRAMIELVQRGLQLGEDSSTATSSSSTHEEDSASRRFIVCTPEGTEKAKVPISDRFLFVSETCLPIVPLYQLEPIIYDSSSSSGKSWIVARNTPNNGYARQQQWDRIHRIVPRPKICKSDQWILLNRNHALQILRDFPRVLVSRRCKPLWTCFCDVKASDEMYFATALALLGVLDVDVQEKEEAAVSGNDVLMRRITYSDWSDNAKNPASFTTAREFEQAVKRAWDEGCLFARKFVVKEEKGEVEDGKRREDGITLQQWMEVVQRYPGIKE